MIADVPGPEAKNPVALVQRLVKPEDVTYYNPVAIAVRSGAVHFLFCLEYIRFAAAAAANLSRQLPKRFLVQRAEQSATNETTAASIHFDAHHPGQQPGRYTVVPRQLNH